MFKSIHHSYRADPVNLMFTGIRGKGKTLSMTALAKFFYDMANGSLKVWSNYPITFGEYHPNLPLEICDYPEWLRNGIILIDEIATFATALRSLSGQALEFSTFLQQVRKRHIHVWSATQFPWMVASYTNTQINAFVMPELHDYYAIPDDDPRADTVWLSFFDWFGYYGDPLNQRYAHWPPPMEESISAMGLEGLIASGAYDLYDTENVVEPAWLKRRSVEEVARECIVAQPDWTPLVMVLDKFKACGIKNISHLKVALEEVQGIELGTISNQRGNAKELARWG